MSDESVAVQKNDKYAKRRFSADALPPRLAAAGAPIVALPTKAAYKIWGPYLLPDLGVDPDGWWYAVCPLHGDVKTAEPSAMISFVTGSMRCLADPPCHEVRESGRMKTSRSLTSVYIDVLRRNKEVAASAETD